MSTPRTADLIPGTPVGNPDEYEVQRLQAVVKQLEQRCTTLTNQYTGAQATIARQGAAMAGQPSPTLVQSMLSEANASAVNASAQRDSLIQQMQAAEMRIEELDKSLLGMQTVAKHLAGTHENDRLEAAALAQNFREELTRLTRENGDMTRENASMYTAVQVEETRRTLITENEQRLAALKAEARAQDASAKTELTRVKLLLQASQEEVTAGAIDVDANSAQAQFIKNIRARCEAVAKERDTYRRTVEDLIAQIATADETLQGATAQHYDNMAAARLEVNSLKSQIQASAVIHQQDVVTIDDLMAKAVLLQDQLRILNARDEQSTRDLIEGNRRNDEIVYQLRHDVLELETRANAVVDRAALQDLTDEHSAEVRTTKVAHDHHVEELIGEIGQLQAELSQVNADLGWYQDNYQEGAYEEEDEEEEEVPRNANANATTGAPPPMTGGAAGGAPPAWQGGSSTSNFNANAPGFQPSSSEVLLVEVARRLADIAEKEAGKDGAERIPTRKELETVKVPQWPVIATWRDWTTQLTRNVNTAANRFDDSAIGWLLKAYNIDSTFDEFYECPKEFLTLDRKLAKSLTECIPRYLKDRITNKETVYHSRGQQIKGRQILWMICREFDVNTDLGFMYSIEDLSLMPFTGDKDLQGFLNKWDEILSCVSIDKIEPATLAKMFQKKLLGSTIMKAEVARWRRLETGHADKTYEWLRRCIETTLRLDREDKNQDGLQASHRKGANTKWQPAAPGEGKGKGQGKGKKGGEQGGGGPGAGKGKDQKGKGKGKGKDKKGARARSSTPG